MAGLIPQWFIDDLLNRVDVVEVIDARVPLKKAGHEYKACCPFHTEKTPSFTVSPGKQFYHCFGCGAHGTALGFLMEYEHMDFVEAVETLAAHAGVEVPHEQATTEQAAQRDGEDLYQLMEQVSQYYRGLLKQNQRAINYLKDRGLSGEIAKEFGLGFAPAGWDNLIKNLGDARQAALLKAGMLSEGDNGRVYDRFRERIMFPIRDRRGRVIAFGGRILAGDGAKYLNSPETPIFHKGRELYGLHEARQAVRKLERLYVVEGYMDVIALAQNDVRNVVATLGTATTPEHLKQLFRVVPEVVFCFDGDRAGREAAWRALENALPEMRDGRMIRFLFLPDGEDPDSLVRKQGKIGFEQLAMKAQPLSEFFYARLAQDVDLESADGRSRLAQLAQPLIQRLPGGVFHELMLSMLAEKTGVSAERLEQVKQLESEKPLKRPDRAKGYQKTPVRHLITLLLQQPELAMQAEDIETLGNINLPGIDLLAQLLEFIKTNPNIHAGVILEHWRDSEYAAHLMKLAQAPIELEEHRLEAEFTDTLNRLLESGRSEIKRLTEKLAQGETLSDSEKEILRNAAVKNR
jgi:DNA primase